MINKSAQLIIWSECVRGSPLMETVRIMRFLKYNLHHHFPRLSEDDGTKI